MILDTLENWHLYRALGSRFELGFSALRDGIGQKTDGKYELDGQNLIAIVQRYQTRPRDKCAWEAHRKYIDVQFIQDGAERMGWAPISGLTVRDPYNAEKDAEFFTHARGEFFMVAARSFAIFFPTDVHMPGLQIDAPQPVAKAVLKIAV